MEYHLRKLVSEEVEKLLQSKRYKLRIDKGRSIAMASLPFPPFIGLQFNHSGAHIEITQIFWNEKESCFDCKCR